MKDKRVYTKEGKVLRELSIYRAYFYISIICVFILVAVLQTNKLNDEIKQIKVHVERSKAVVIWYERTKEFLKEVK